MNKIFTIIIISFLSALTSLFGQTVNDSIYKSWWTNIENSIFESINTGQFKGTTTGYVQLKNNQDTLVLDFLSTETTLTINKIEEPVYDDNTKTYVTKTTSGKTTLKYETFMLVNILTVILNGEYYNIGVFDGASDMPISGLTFNYCHENNIEYLTLFVSKPLQLKTTRYLMKSKNIYYREAEKMAKTITLLSGSTLVLIVEK